MCVWVRLIKLDMMERKVSSLLGGQQGVTGSGEGELRARAESATSLPFPLSLSPLPTLFDFAARGTESSQVT